MARRYYAWPVYEKSPKGYVAPGEHETITAILVYADKHSRVKGLLKRPVEKVSSLALLYYPLYVACLLRQCLVLDAGGWIRGGAGEPIDMVIENIGVLADIAILIHESGIRRLPGYEARAKRIRVDEKYLEEHIMPDEAYIPMPPRGPGYYHIPFILAEYTSIEEESRRTVYAPLSIYTPIKGYGKIDEFPGVKHLVEKTMKIPDDTLDRVLRKYNILDDTGIVELIRKGLLELMKKRIVKPSQMMRINNRYL